MKKILSLLMVIVMFLSAIALASCGNTGSTQGPNTDKPNGDTTTEERIPLDLPDANYAVSGEATIYNILEWACGGQNEPTPGGWIPWEEGDVDTLDGDMLGKAVFDRNAWVEQEYGVEITKEYASVEVAPTFITRLRNNMDTGDDLYQLVTMRSRNLISFVQEELLFDMNTYKDTILHTDQPWWVQSSVEAYTLGSHLYAACTEFLLRDKGATAALYFNQQIVKDYQDELPNFFQLVDDKEWTFEQMIDACEVVSGDMDGDDEMASPNDMWGIVGGDDPVFFLYAATGNRFAHIDDAGYLEYDFGYNGDTVIIMQEIFEDVMYADWYLNAALAEDQEIISKTEGDVFKDGYSLFSGSMVKGVTHLSDMQSIYGILPYPMYNDDQERYYSLVWIHHDSTVAIPAHAKNTEMCATILEALSWESYYSVYPTFYETILLDRAAKDEDSRRMLEIIFNTRLYDPGQYWDTVTGLQHSEGLLRLTSTGNADIASVWGRFESKVRDCVDTINAMVQDLEG
jgi:predicted small lipoprotein YifL